MRVIHAISSAYTLTATLIGGLVRSVAEARTIRSQQGPHVNEYNGSLDTPPIESESECKEDLNYALMQFTVGFP